MTRWFCQGCPAHGALADEFHGNVIALIQALEGAHRDQSPYCPAENIRIEDDDSGEPVRVHDLRDERGDDAVQMLDEEEECTATQSQMKSGRTRPTSPKRAYESLRRRSSA